MTTDVSQDRRVTVVIQGSKHPALSEGSRPCWALPSPVHERSGYRVSCPTGYKVMRSSRIAIHGPGLASRRACHRDRARCRSAILALNSSPSRPLTRRLRRWPTASLDRSSPQRQRPPPTNDALLTTHNPYKDDGSNSVSKLVIARSESDEAIHASFTRKDGLLRSARNDAVSAAHSKYPRHAGERGTRVSKHDGHQRGPVHPSRRAARSSG
jgi:hypothetical protein